MKTLNRQQWIRRLAAALAVILTIATARLYIAVTAAIMVVTLA